MTQLQKQTGATRRTFFKDLAAGAAVGALLPNALTAHAAAEPESDHNRDCTWLPHEQADREAFELLARGFFQAYDRLDLEAFLAYFAADGSQQDGPLGDLSAYGVPGDGCSIRPKTALRELFTGIFESFRATGEVGKFNHASGSGQFGGAAEVWAVPHTFFSAGWDSFAYLDVRDGKIFRRVDYWDSAQLSAQDQAGIHPGGVPRLSCEALPEPGDIAHASADFHHFVRILSRALSLGGLDELAQLLADDVVLVHPFLAHADGEYGPFNTRIQIRGRRAVLRFFKAALAGTPDGEGSSLIHVVGSSVGGAFQWRSGGTTAHQGIARNGILGATALDLFGGRIQRISTKFDTLQMTAQQRTAIRRAVARECLTA
jgi:ketosteroid isomerase-like protein